jgi:hypothetical protein
MAIKKSTPTKSGSVKSNFLKAPITGKEADEDLSRMEADIRKLKIEYEQYFGGGKSRPPSDTEWRIEATIKRYGDRGAEMNYHQRFRFGNLSQTFAKYKEIFHKRLRKREEGTVDRHYGAAARAIEAERARTHKPRIEPPAQAPPPPGPQPFAVSCSDPASEPRKVEQIYKAFRQALEHSGQSVDKLSPRAFEAFLRSKVEQLRKQKGGEDVEVVVSLEDGKAVLKARVKN